MEQNRIGELIRSLRCERQLTQQQLADKMHISDKTVSKWERGCGCPDIALLQQLSEIFGVNLENLLAGNMDTKATVAGNLKKTQFFVCPTCGNLFTATGETVISCCGKKLQPLTPQKAAPAEKLTVETTDGMYCISAAHEMTKEHYVSFIAFLTGDTMLLRKLYPEWNLETRLPFFAHGLLVWYCNRDGLFYQYV